MTDPWLQVSSSPGHPCMPFSLPKAQAEPQWAGRQLAQGIGSQSGGLRPHREASVAALPSCASSPQHPPPLHILQGGLILRHHPASSGKAQSAAPSSYLCHPGRCLELWLWGHTVAAAVSWSSTAGIHTHQNEEDSGLTSVLGFGHGVRSSLLSLTSSFPRLRAHHPGRPAPIHFTPTAHVGCN